MNVRKFSLWSWGEKDLQSKDDPLYSVYSSDKRLRKLERDFFTEYLVLYSDSMDKNIY